MPYDDPERRRAYGRDWMRRNAEKAREAMRRWRKRHRDEHNEDVRRYYARNRYAALATDMAYRKAKPEVHRASDHLRRARLSGAGGSYTRTEWLQLVARFAGRCAYCGREGPLQVEHRVPIGRGGTNDIANILPACASCNLRKHALTEDEFRRRLRDASG